MGKRSRKNSRKNKKRGKKKRRYIPPERYINKSVRNRVIKRDENRCVYCNKKARRKVLLLKRIKLEFGHVIPHSKGGDRCINNIQLECFSCNRSKGATRKKIGLINRVLFDRGAKGCKKHND